MIGNTAFNRISLENEQELDETIDISRLSRKRDRMIPMDFKQNQKSLLETRNILDLSEFEPIYYRQSDSTRKEEVNGLWDSMDQLSIKSSEKDSRSIVSDNAPPQFSSKFLYEDEPNFDSLPQPFMKPDSLLPRFMRDSFVKNHSAVDLPQRSNDWSESIPDTGYGYPTQPVLRKSASMANMNPYDYNVYPNQAIPPRQHRLSDSIVFPSQDLGYNGVCRYFAQGYCSRGDRCHFAHVSPGQGHVRSFTHSPTMVPVQPQMPPQLVPKFVLPKKRLTEEDASRFLHLHIDDLVGQIYFLCKDQYGCRFLQKQIDELQHYAIKIILNEIFAHFTELMTDPFGNYLCQKLVEFCNDEQRGEIVELVARELIHVSLNMHGTRAVQKLIEFVTVPQQIKSIITSLNQDAITLIKDLNGNHVIQKCLAKLSHLDNQFVFDTVAAHCVQVATHRHGCCVLQRCIDFAIDAQRFQIVAEIAANALSLVQVLLINKDPFGNYVVQYVLDLGNSRHSAKVIEPFVGNVCLLSTQKFSSNVIEKCIRAAQVEMRSALIDELLDQERLEALLRDSFANYVVQTALDFASLEQREKLIDCIKPILPAIRNTPYGKRIQTKLKI